MSMERLTKRQAFTVGGVIYAKCEHCQDRRPECFGEQCPVPDEALIRLAAYEDIGMEPEEIKDFVSRWEDAVELAGLCKEAGSDRLCEAAEAALKAGDTP